MVRLKVWLQQPTSVAGLATIFGTLSALLTQQITLAQATPLVAAALVSILVPDNTRGSSSHGTGTNQISESTTAQKE